MNSFLTLLQLERTSSIYQSMVINANILPLPAVIMMAVAGRGFIFWCLNILCIPVVLSQAKIIVFGKSRKSEANTHRTDTVYERNQADSNNVQEVCNTRSIQMCFRWSPIRFHSRVNSPRRAIEAATATQVIVCNTSTITWAISRINTIWVERSVVDMWNRWKTLPLMSRTPRIVQNLEWAATKRDHRRSHRGVTIVKIRPAHCTWHT